MAKKRIKGTRISNLSEEMPIDNALTQQQEEKKPEEKKEIVEIDPVQEPKEGKLNALGARYYNAINEAIEELTKGRTFYDGYFDQPYLSRVDKTLKILLTATDRMF